MQMSCITNQPLIQNLAGLILINMDLESYFLKCLTDCRHWKLFIRPLYWIWFYIQYLYLIWTRPRKWMVNNCNLHTFFNQIFLANWVQPFLGLELLIIIKLLKACQLTAAFKNDAKLSYDTVNAWMMMIFMNLKLIKYNVDGELAILSTWFMTMTLSEEEDDQIALLHDFTGSKVSRQKKVRIFYNYAFYIQHYLLFVCVNSPVLFYRVSFPIQEFIPLCMLLLKLIVVDKILLKQTWLSKWLLNFDRMKCSGAAKLASEVQELLSNYY